jgi:type 1 fimbria pilin
MASTTFSGPVTSNNGFISGSGSVVSLSSDVSLTSASHAGRVMLLDKADGLTVTLPAASGSGNVYKFFVKTTVTSNNYVIQLSGSDTMSGVAVVANDGGNGASIFETASDSSTITLDGSTKGGILGGMVELQDLYSGKYLVKIHQSATDTEATPFS